MSFQNRAYSYSLHYIDMGKATIKTSLYNYNKTKARIKRPTNALISRLQDVLIVRVYLYIHTITNYPDHQLPHPQKRRIVAKTRRPLLRMNSCGAFSFIADHGSDLKRPLSKRRSLSPCSLSPQQIFCSQARKLNAGVITAGLNQSAGSAGKSGRSPGDLRQHED